MTRTVRIWSGAVVAGVLLLIALVAGVIAGASSAGNVGDFLSSPTEPVDTRAEILDIDDDPFLGGVTYVDISLTDARDEVVVTYVEWFGDADPQLGAMMDIVYDATDPEYAFDALDPIVGGAGQAPDADQGAGGSDGVGRVAGWVALAALIVGLLVGGLTVPWALAKPARNRSPDAAGGPVDGRYLTGQSYPAYPPAAQWPATPSPVAASPVAGAPSQPRVDGWSEPF